ncbi:MAG: cysteine--tRNA ligase [Patescibacteria group bacterium]
MKFYNTLTHRTELFGPLHDKTVGVYTCGPTVYDYAHIGNLRSYVFADGLVRTLKFFGYRVKWVMNITDIDDKTIAAAARAKTTLKAFTKKYTDLFLLDLKLLNLTPASAYPRATDHIKEMRVIIAKLKARGLAYDAEDGTYFAIAKYKAYGKLSGLKKRQLMPGARVDVDAYDKQSPADFALWKKEGDRPGWHIECSAMSRKYLGQPFDIHTGGVDLIFPHHENEIAQSAGAYGTPLARYFLHNEHLLVDGKKMAKSEGNYVTLRDVVDKGFDPLALRYLFLSVHYREKMNFTWESLTAAEEALRHIRQTLQRSSAVVSSTVAQEKVQGEIEAALADDLSIPKALALLHTANDPALWLHFDSVLGLNLKPLNVKLSAPQRRLLKKREALRRSGKFAQADQIRHELAKQGIALEDTPDGVRFIR